MLGFSREAIRVKVKKYENSQPTEFRKFSVDPQITSFEVLQSILAKAFDLKGDFAICYRLIDGAGNEVYLPLLSDWDLDDAFLKTYNISLLNKSEPCLCLKVDLKPFHDYPEECEVKQFNYSITKQLISLQEVKSPARLHGIFNQVGKTINLMQKAFNFGEDGSSTIPLQFPPKAPLSDAEFRRYLDPVGQIINAKELRSCIYFGGIEPSLRKVVWKHLLNVYPKGMSGRERMDYIKRKAAEYHSLKEVWKNAIAQGPVDGELAYTTGMVKKDVLRTDRHLDFYAGNDENQNIASLFNILTTYALNHPKVSYCQGMSDLASPLLVTMNDEAHAYICFCALMGRLSTNFMIDGIAMTQKFTHLSEALMYYDPDFYNYLKIHQADDLLFGYRWLLLEMKREFAFDDSLRMLEVLWSSLPADPPQIELKLFEFKFQHTSFATPPISPLVKAPLENAYTKLCALRRRSSSISLNNAANKKKLDKSKRMNHSLDEIVIKSKIMNESKVKQQSLDDAAIHNNTNDNSPKSVKTPKSPKSPSSNDKIVLQSSSNQLQNSDLITVSPLEEKSDSAVYVSNKKNNAKVDQKSLSSSMTNLIKNNKGKHFRELKEKIVSSKIFSSLEQLDSSLTEIENKPLGKMIKNFNEFNFISKSKNKIFNLGSADSDNPKITLTKSNQDDSEASSLGQNSSNFSKSRCISTTSCSGDDTFDDYSPDDQEYISVTTTVSDEMKLKMEKLEHELFGEHANNEKLIESSDCKDEVHHVSNEFSKEPTRFDVADSKKVDDVFVWENPLHQSSPSTLKPLPGANNKSSVLNQSFDSIKNAEIPVLQNLSNDNIKWNGIDNSCEEVTENINKSSALPPPDEFGGGNPFLMFLCITVLLQHRDHIMSKRLDYNETAMHFDKMIRRHNVVSVLNQARQMYGSYMKQQSFLLRHHKT